MMSNTRKQSLKPAAHESRAESVSGRPDRQKLRDGFRNILTVEGQDPNYSYRWVLDHHNTYNDDSNRLNPGQRILQMQHLGWEFVKNNEVTVGDASVLKTENVGSIVRIPAGQGEYQYLMRIKKEYRDEDQAIKQKEIEEVEDSIKKPGPENYGSVSIGFK